MCVHVLVLSVGLLFKARLLSAAIVAAGTMQGLYNSTVRQPRISGEMRWLCLARPPTTI